MAVIRDTEIILRSKEYDLRMDCKVVAAPSTLTA